MSDIEEWMPFPGYSRYYVSNKGKIKRIKKRKKNNGKGFSELLLKPRNINGYLAHTLVNDGGQKKTVYIHQAIAICFTLKPDTKNKLIVSHKDGDKTNNFVKNLEWITFSKFMKTEFQTGRRTNKDLWAKRVKRYGPMGGKKPPGRKVNISFTNVEDIYHKYNNDGFTLKKIADQYNCSPSHIYNLLQRYAATNSNDEINKGV